MFSKYIQTNCWHFRGGKCRLQNHVGSKFDNKFSDKKFSSIHFWNLRKRTFPFLKVFLFHKEVMIPPLRCQLRMLSVWILNRIWQNVGLVWSSSKRLFHTRMRFKRREMPKSFWSRKSWYVSGIVQFGNTICYAAEIGEVEGQTGKRLDVEFGKKQGRRISPSSDYRCSPEKRSALKLLCAKKIVPRFFSDEAKS